LFSYFDVCDADGGALIVASVDGDYLRTPLTRAGWGLFNYNIVVGDMEAPLGSGKDNWQLVEGTSITAAAAVSSALLWTSSLGGPRERGRE
jgi:hypothetical protein